MMRRHDDSADDHRVNPVNIWAARHGWTIIVGLTYALGAWFALNARVTRLDESKVDNAIFTRHVVRPTRSKRSF